MSLIPKPFRKLTFKKVFKAAKTVVDIAKPVVQSLPVVGGVEKAVEGVVTKVGKDIKAIEKTVKPAVVQLAQDVKGAPSQVKTAAATQAAINEAQKASVPLLLGAVLVLLLLRRK